MSTQGAVAIIPARGGSKRLPRKNLAPFFGKSLLEYAVRAAQAAKHVTAGVYVSTEDAEIAAVARELGAEVIERPVDLALDGVWTQRVLQHAVEYLQDRGVTFDVIARVQCSPQVEVEKIDEALEKLWAHDRWEIFSVNEEGVEDSVIHVLRRECVGQEALSVYKGVVQTDYVDVHTQADLDALERKRVEKIERESLRFLWRLARQYNHASLRNELEYVVRGRRSLWLWQTRVPLWNRWRAIVNESADFRNLLYSRDGYARASDLRVLDLGVGFGMYWPILREFGVRKFVGVDLFDMRRRESYWEAAQAYVQQFCPDCETQLIMDDARNLGAHQLQFGHFDVILAVATASTKLRSTGIPRDIFDEVVARYGAPDCLPIYVEKVPVAS